MKFEYVTMHRNPDYKALVVLGFPKRNGWLEECGSSRGHRNSNAMVTCSCSYLQSKQFVANSLAVFVTWVLIATSVTVVEKTTPIRSHILEKSIQ